jgi:hypothetical protein
LLLLLMFALRLFVSATLLFPLQPMIGKMLFEPSCPTERLCRRTSAAEPGATADRSGATRSGLLQGILV